MKASQVCKSALDERADEIARTNGRAKDRSLEDYRFWAGVAEGLRLAVTIVSHELQRFEDDE